MLKQLPFCVVTLLALSFGVQVFAQSADAPADSSSTAPASSMDGSIPSTTPTRGAPIGVSTSSKPASSTPPLQGRPASTGTSASTPRSGTSTPVITPASSVSDVHPTPTQPVLPSLSPVSPPETPAANNMPLVAVVSGVFVLALGAVLFMQRAKKKENKKAPPCDDLKNQYEVKKAEYEQALKNITLQELLIQGLEKKIEEMKEKVEEEAAEAVKKTGHKIKDELIAKEKTGTLKKAVGVVEGVKETYDALKEKYEQAKKWLETLKNLKAILAREVAEREVAYNVCMAGGVVLDAVRGGGKSIDLPSLPQGKTILVDAVYTFVNAHGKIIEAIYQLLEAYPNKKILLTNADDEQMEKWGLHDMPYEVFTLKHAPEKTEPAYYEKMLSQFGLDPKDVVCIEHNEEAVKSAQSVGVTTHYYDKDKKDLKALKQFLDENV